MKEKVKNIIKSTVKCGNFKYNVIELIIMYLEKLCNG
jgi:hypothetical protein